MSDQGARRNALTGRQGARWNALTGGRPCNSPEQDEVWDFSGLEDLPAPKWTEDELEDAYARLLEPPLTWCIAVCHDGIGHAFELDGDGRIIPRAVCGRLVFLDQEKSVQPNWFCADCIYKKAPN